jgi:hypothetical protein
MSLVWNILNSQVNLLLTVVMGKTEKKAVFAIVLFPIKNIPDEGHYLSRKQVGSALTETENWDLLVDCTSREMAPLSIETYLSY